jgi:CRISPR-associated endonuclease/helicase Cas3
MMTEKGNKSGLYSHPNVFLEDHINGVIGIARQILGEIPEWFYIPLAFHDFGKATRYFQDYIQTGKKTHKEELTNHSYLSAVFCVNVAYNLGFKDRLVESFIFPLKHHTDLENLKGTLNDILKKSTKKDILKQIEALDIDGFERFVQNIEIPKSIKDFLLKQDTLQNLKKDLIEFLDKEIKIKKEENSVLGKILDKIEEKRVNFYEFNFYFSVLLDADKTQAGSGSDTLPQPKLPDFQRIESYKSHLSKGQDDIIKRRETAFREVMENFDKGKGSRVFTLVLPTGMGKTLTGLSVALKLAKEGEHKRIIYSLPFLSIIDQTEMVLRNGLNLKSSEELLVYHHLAEPTYKESDKEYDFDVGRVFYEGWNSGVILTTFYQLFYTLLGLENGYLRRFNKFKDAIIILDEIQALPPDYWLFVKESLNHLSQNLNARIILMTATNPFIYKEGEAFELVEKSKYRKGLNRYKMVIELQGRGIEELAKEVAERVEREKDKSFLIILNTIASSQNFYKILRGMVDVPMTYLSTAVVPYERKERIKGIKEGRYRVVVSTQVVEAGMDIDFDVVYRDFAPLDSINQSAGRCNRNGERSVGEVRVVNLKNEKNEEFAFAKKIYDNNDDFILLDTTEEMLKNLSELREEEFLELIDKYYEMVWEKKSPDRSKELLEYVKKLKYEKLVKFKLIKEEPYKHQVFVVLNDEARKVLERVKEVIRNVRNGQWKIWEARSELEKIKAHFYSFVINVNLGRSGDSIPIDEDLQIYVIDSDVLKQYYYEEVGFYPRDIDLVW